MKIGILSRNEKLYSTQRLVEAAKALGHQVLVIDPLLCYMNITSHKPSIHYKEKILDDLDAVIPRIGASITFYGTAVVRQFEMLGIYTLNSSLSISRSRDKLRALQILSKKKIGLPVSGFAHSTKMTKEMIELVGGPPLLVKLLQGTQGKGIVLTETAQAAESVVEAFRGLDAYFLVQEFVKETLGCDIRCFVIGNKVVASILRRAKKGEFRSNIHRGGSYEPIKITANERQAAIRAMKAMGLRVGGVDLLRSKRGPLVMEVNSSPGLEGIEKGSSKDIAKLVIQYATNHAHDKNHSM